MLGERSLSMKWFALAVLCFGCSDDDFGHDRAASDMPVVVDQAGVQDAAVAADVAVPADMAVPADLASTDWAGPDLTVSIDL
jgi:hypothetical protein